MITPDNIKQIINQVITPYSGVPGVEGPFDVLLFLKMKKRIEEWDKVAKYILINPQHQSVMRNFLREQEKINPHIWSDRCGGYGSIYGMIVVYDNNIPENCGLMLSDTEEEWIGEYSYRNCIFFYIPFPNGITKQKDLREKSGNIDFECKLTSFLYELMRDHVVPGKIEEIMKNCSQVKTEYTNGWLAQYADDVAKRLK